MVFLGPLPDAVSDSDGAGMDGRTMFPAPRDLPGLSGLDRTNPAHVDLVMRWLLGGPSKPKPVNDDELLS
jgi:hypothetical protein